VSDKPSVLFVCVHNVGRSQMAAGWLRHLAGDRVEIRSAGSEPAETINPVAIQAMREVGFPQCGRCAPATPGTGCWPPTRYATG
jgi:arsenate reductase (thioredoxin)